MKKAMLVCAGLVALCNSSAAHAIPSFTNRALVVDGTTLTLGTLNFLPIGTPNPFPPPPAVGPGACLYQAAWISPQNPNDVRMCLVQESITNFAPSCIANSTKFVNGTVVQSNTAQCTGFDLMGVAHPTQLLLGSNAAGLSGLAIENLGAMVAMFPVHLP